VPSSEPEAIRPTTVVISDPVFVAICFVCLVDVAKTTAAVSTSGDGQNNYSR